ncbi:MAG: hypothetical protein GY756_18950, partial [bacterium]|nr:hypothetical protein [bacterium]
MKNLKIIILIVIALSVNACSETKKQEETFDCTFDLIMGMALDDIDPYASKRGNLYITKEIPNIYTIYFKGIRLHICPKMGLSAVYSQTNYRDSTL